MADDEIGSGSTPQSAGGGPHGTVVLSPNDLPNRAEPGVTDTSALIGVTSPFTDRRFPVQPERARVGRGAENDVVVDERDVSLEHARIVRTGGEWRVVDLRSTNGTFVNGKRVNQSVLQYGDQVAFGPASFIFAPSGMSSEAVRAMRSGNGRQSRWWIGVVAVVLAAAVLLLLIL